jgi:hypothetical protein
MGLYNIICYEIHDEIQLFEETIKIIYYLLLLFIYRELIHFIFCFLLII